MALVRVPGDEMTGDVFINPEHVTAIETFPSDAENWSIRVHLTGSQNDHSLYFSGQGHCQQIIASLGGTPG